MQLRQSNRSTRRSFLGLEPLETRTMMAGNVTATVTKGTLVIRGDAAANEIMISQSNVAGGFTITPIAGSSTTINSLTSALNLTGVVRLDIRMGAGNDVVGIGNDTAFLGDLLEAISTYGEEVEEEPGNLFDWLSGNDEEPGFDVDEPEFTNQQLAQFATRVTGLTYIELGDGDDTLVTAIRSNSTLQVEGGKGADRFMSVLTNVTHMTVNTDPARGTGMGEDLAAVIMGNVRGNLAITTEGENDGVMILGTSAGMLGVNTGGAVTGQQTDNDVVLFKGVSAADHVGIQTEVGDDTIVVEQIIADNLRIYAGTGNDEVEIRGAALLALVVDTAAGEDSVNINDGENGALPLVVRRNVSINTGTDDDEVEIDGGLLGMLVGGVLDIRTGQGNDSLTIERVKVNTTAVIDTDSGNDEISIDGLDVRNTLVFNGGAGNDVLTIRNLSAKSTSIKGGTGNDVLHDLGDHDVEIKDSQFETVDEGA